MSVVGASLAAASRGRGAPLGSPSIVVGVADELVVGVGNVETTGLGRLGTGDGEGATQAVSDRTVAVSRFTATTL